MIENPEMEKDKGSSEIILISETDGAVKSFGLMHSGSCHQNTHVNTSQNAQWNTMVELP